MLIPKLQLDLKGLLVVATRLREVALFLRDSSELMIGGSCLKLIPKLQIDLQRLLVVATRLREVAFFLSDPSEVKSPEGET